MKLSIFILALFLNPLLGFAQEQPTFAEGIGYRVEIGTLKAHNIILRQQVKNAEAGHGIIRAAVSDRIAALEATIAAQSEDNDTLSSMNSLLEEQWDDLDMLYYAEENEVRRLMELQNEQGVQLEEITSKLSALCRKLPTTELVAECEGLTFAMQTTAPTPQVLTYVVNTE